MTEAKEQPKAKPIVLGDRVEVVLNDEGSAKRIITGWLVDRERETGERHGTVWLSVARSIQAYSDKNIKELRHAGKGPNTQAPSVIEHAPDA